MHGNDYVLEMCNSLWNMKLMFFALNKKNLKAIIVQLLMMVNVDYGNGVNDGYNINIIIIITKMTMMTTVMIVKLL